MEESYLVTKSNYFIMNSSYDLSLEEQKIILTLASMVQPSDEEFKPYKFRIIDFMGLLGVDTKTKYTEIPKITKELMKKVFEIHEGNKMIQTAWLCGAVYEKGAGYVELTFSPYLKPYMLQLKEKFTQYQLANVLSMKSKYSPRIYEILKCNEFKKQGYTEISIDELRKLLRADNIYPLYNDFKRKIVQQAQKEIKKLSDISFEFEEIKTGRKVTSLKFYISKNKPIFKVVEEISVTSNLECIEEKNGDSMSLISEIKAIFKEDITDLDLKKILDVAKGNINIVAEKYRLASDAPAIKNIVGWVIEAIKKDYKPTKGKVGSSGIFNNYGQRTYNFEKLERQLLGWDKKTNEPTGAYQQLIIKGNKE